MKELTIEEKAKRYDEAITKGKQILNIPYTAHWDTMKEVVEHLFPELKESEDERMRNAAIDACKYMVDNFENSTKQYEDAIAWLEKQSEQKPQGKSALEAAKEEKIDNANKVEPKFKVGDIITNGEIIGKVDENENNKYHGWFGYDKDLSVHCADIPDVENWHLWTIQDAKDGDILVDNLGNICIYQEPSTKLTYHSFCYGNHKWFIAVGGSHKIVGTCPATKEQSNLLFQKMKEAGYKWDAEKKGLKKISQEYPLTPDECIKSSWSEEDVKTLNRISAILVDASEVKNWWKESRLIEREEMITLTDFLKSLRPQNWTKEDKERYISCLQRLGTGNPEQPETINSKWFKEHVYPQEKWKPSDKQLEAVRIAAEIGTANDYWAMGILKGMYQDLKKLREE